MDEEKIMHSLFILMALCGETNEHVFTNIYHNKTWGTNRQGEGHSGGGSTLQSTEQYRKFLQNFLLTHQITSVVDLGCGDWEFSKSMNWTNINYLGIEVVKSLVEKNQTKYGSLTINFVHMSDSSDLPSSDLLIIKDVLQHLSNQDIFTILGQFPKYKYVLITNDIDQKTLTSTNPDIPSGEYRVLDLTKHPFLLKASKVLTYKTVQNRSKFS